MTWHSYLGGGGGTPHRKTYSGRVGHRIYFGDETNTWVETPHNIEGWAGGHRTYFVAGRNNWGGDTTQH